MRMNVYDEWLVYIDKCEFIQPKLPDDVNKLAV